MHLCVIRTITKLKNMKKITLLLFLFTAWTGFSQQTVLEDFDGSAPNTADENGTTNVVIEGIAGGAPESAGGGNNSLKIITSASGQPWQGAAVVTQDNYIDMSGTDKTLTVDVYSDNILNILGKLEGGQLNGEVSKTSAAHTGSGWETLTFNFNVAADVGQGGTTPPVQEFESIRFYPLFNTGTDGWCGLAGQGTCGENAAIARTLYIDNITAPIGSSTDTCSNGVQDGDETDIDCGGSCATCPEPVVIELNGSESWESYINAFTLDDVYQFGFAPSGPESLKTEVVTDGVKFFPNFDVWDENDATPQNGNPAWNTDWFSAPSVTSKKLEANLYITDNTLIGKDITFNGTIPENNLVNTYEVRVFIKTLNSGFADTGDSDVKILSASETGTFSLNVSREASLGATYIQYGFAVYGECADPVTEFVLGNVKFSSETLGVASNELNTFKVYPNPTLGDWTVKAQNTIQAIQVYDILGKKVFASKPNNTEAIISTDALRTGVYFAKVTSNNVEKTVKLIKQ